LIFLAKEINTMQIKVNDQTIEIFSGACVKDVLRKYSRSEWKLVQKNEKKVCDRHGHEVSLDGELSGGEEFFIKSVDLLKAKP
jgi:sulfur carrier protein ThiS